MRYYRDGYGHSTTVEQIVALIDSAIKVGDDATLEYSSRTGRMQGMLIHGREMLARVTPSSVIPEIIDYMRRRCDKADDAEARELMQMLDDE